MTTNRPIVPREIRKVYAGRIFTVQVETITTPKGGEMKVEVVRHPGSVVLVPVTDAGDIILVRQYRHAIGRWVWELPAGSLEPGEDIEQAAIRELHEEVGLIPGHLEKLGALFPTPGYCDEEMHLYRATGLRQPHDGDKPVHQDEDEDIEVKTFPTQALRHMIASGEIIDLKTIAGLGLVSLG